jgi:dynein heavy chain
MLAAAQVVQGLMRADPRSTGTPQQLLALWLHETSRVFEDRCAADGVASSSLC